MVELSLLANLIRVRVSLNDTACMCMCFCPNLYELNSLNIFTSFKVSIYLYIYMHFYSDFCYSNNIKLDHSYIYIHIV